MQRKCIRSGFSCGAYGANGILGPDSVKALQRMLIGWGYSCGDAAADGILGAQTAKAVQRSLNDRRWS